MKKRKAKAEVGTCATPDCPYRTPLVRGLCHNCYGWVNRWTRASAAHWEKFRSSFRLRTERMRRFSRADARKVA